MFSPMHILHVHHTHKVVMKHTLALCLGRVIIFVGDEFMASSYLQLS